MDLTLLENLNNGNKCVAPNSATYIDKRAVIAERVVILPGVTIFGPVIIEADVKILPNVLIAGDSLIGAHSVILPNTILSNVRTGESCILGGHLTDVQMGARCRTGPLSEISRCILGNEVTCIHHSFLGDAEVGDCVNIGAGTVTSNFDGERKNKTITGRDSFIGVNVNLVAKNPALLVGCNTFIAAGVTIRQNIPDNSFVKPKLTKGEDIEIRPNSKVRSKNNRWISSTQQITKAS